jgi:NAD(P)-dependent dehydrogenase (short-subunit alcohol dehydrogenase family)
MASSGIRQIAGKVALVTGGASGLGRGTVERFVRNGAKVVILDLPSSPGQEVASSLGEDNAIFVPTDVTSEAEVKNALEVTKDKFKNLDVAVNCAGIGVAILTYNAKKENPQARIHNLDLFQVRSPRKECFSHKRKAWCVRRGRRRPKAARRVHSSGRAIAEMAVRPFQGWPARKM